MELCYFQRGFNYSQDGPGNRLVYHLTGCNMRCPWCSNPEGMAAGVDTCIETNASHPRLPELFPLLNTLIADFKHPDPAAHRRWTGVDSAQVVRNLRAAADYGLPLQLRTPLIHGVNDDDAALEGFVRFFAAINRPGMTVEFLRYHEYGREKWAKLGRDYAMRDAFLPPGRAELFEKTCREAGIEVERT